MYKPKFYIALYFFSVLRGHFINSLTGRNTSPSEEKTLNASSKGTLRHMTHPSKPKRKLQSSNLNLKRPNSL